MTLHSLVGINFIIGLINNASAKNILVKIAIASLSIVEAAYCLQFHIRMLASVAKNVTKPQRIRLLNLR
jgi:hypothetical protein